MCVGPRGGRDPLRSYLAAPTCDWNGRWLLVSPSAHYSSISVARLPTYMSVSSCQFIGSHMSWPGVTFMTSGGAGGDKPVAEPWLEPAEVMEEEETSHLSAGGAGGPEPWALSSLQGARAALCGGDGGRSAPGTAGAWLGCSPQLAPETVSSSLASPRGLGPARMPFLQWCKEGSCLFTLHAGMGAQHEGAAGLPHWRHPLVFL